MGYYLTVDGLIIFRDNIYVMRANIAARMLQLLGLPTLLYQPRVRKNLEVTVLYTQIDAMDPLFVTDELEIHH